MRYEILGFDQAKLMKLNLDLDMVDLLLLDYIRRAESSTQMKHIIEDSISYVWLSHAKIQEDLPFLQLAERTLSSRLTKLKGYGLIASYIVRNGKCSGRGSLSYYAVTDYAISLLYYPNNTTTRSKQRVVRRPHAAGCASNSLLVSNSKLGDNTTYFVSSPAEPGGGHDDAGHYTEDYNDGAMLEPNKNKIDADDVESHGYSKEELKEEFLQSRRKKSTKCKSLFDKCLDEIDSYTDDSKLRQALIDYLTMRLAVKDKPLRGVNQWKGMLNKLSTISGDKLQIVRHCIERGWLSFFPISNGFRNDPSKFGETESVRSEEVPDNWREIERAKAEKLGRRTSF